MAAEKSVFAQTIPELQRWSAQEPISAKKLNEPLDAIDKIVKGVPAPTQVFPPGGGGGGGKSIPVEIIATPTDFPEKVTVQPLKWVDGELVSDGETKTVRTWPDINNDSFTDFIGQPDIFDMVDLGGELCVRHKVRQPMRSVPVGAVIGGCAS